MNIVLSAKDVFEVPAEGAIMAQDTNRLFGHLHLDESPSDEGVAQDMARILELLEEYQPNKQGDIIVSQKEWCAAEYLIEGVIYDVDKEQITSKSIVRYVLESCFIKVIELNLKSISMNLLGTEYGQLTDEDFLEMFQGAFRKYKEDLFQLSQIVFVPKETKKLPFLKGLIQEFFGVVPKIN